MKFIRYSLKDGEIFWGWVHDGLVGPIQGDIFNEYRRLEATIPIEKVKLHSPVQPSKIICIGRNYEEHAKEREVEIPDVPLLFLKPPSAIIAHGEAIVLPPQSKKVEHEGELAVIIGKRGKWIPPEKAKDFICGFTIANDVTARDIQHRDGQWTRGKGFDTFCPIGPWIETEIQASDLLLSCRVNGELRQMSSTKEMVFSISQILSYISNCMTVEPGDVILTGTPAGVSPLEQGDIVEIEIEGIGVLSNPVISTEQ